MLPTDTICAIATAPGGAIGVIRLSGPDAIAIAERVFSRPLQGQPANSVTFGRVTDTDGQTLDEVLVILFRAPHSYTGEDSVEFSCHGSRYILQRVLQRLIESGCRQAGPGEFTQRAFLHGKMDLSQAEGVADLIASQTRAAHRMAMSQMRGTFSRRLQSLRDQLLRLTSLMELELDFSDHEDLEFADRDQLRRIAAEVGNEVGRLVHSFRLGNALKHGVPVAIVGETNAGKSTLLNALVGDDRAIVSDIRGTTRDSIEDSVDIGGTLFRLIDTAGIRDTDNPVEALGIERTFQKISEADIVIWLIDSTCAREQISQTSPQVLPLCADKTVLLVFNKSDLTPASSLPHPADLPLTPTPKSLKTLSLSAKTGAGVAALRQALADTVAIAPDSLSDVIVSNLRHYEALSRAHDAIRRVQDGLDSQLPTDLVAQDLHDCLDALADITGGAITPQETLSNIFSHFCVGK